MSYKVKTESEVASNLFQEYSALDSGLVHYWKLDDNDNTVQNQITSSPNGNLVNSPTWIGNYNGSYYRPEIISSTDYSPFLVRLDNRSFSTSEYRYSGQGQEHDDEIKGEGNSLNYIFRMHDSRLGRFFAVDPLATELPWNSPFAFSENRVIDGIELEGAEWQPINADGNDVSLNSDDITGYRWVGYETAGWTYEGSTYKTREDALTAYQNDMENMVINGVGGYRGAIEGPKPEYFSPEGTVEEAEVWNTTERVFYSSNKKTNEGKIKRVDAVTIIINRTEETKKKTTGNISVAGTEISGPTIEPDGPSTTKSGKNKRIPAGTYNVYSHWRVWHKGKFGLQNENVSKGRTILMHYGKDRTWTEGCVIIGDFNSDNEFKAGSETLNEINDEINRVGSSNSRVIINENYPETETENETDD